MPVKVRCPSCEKVLNAPDAARGKAVRCPKCQSKVKVPTGRPKRAVAQAAAPDSTAFLLNLDAGRIEDRQNRICPKCGTDVSEEDIDCPSCGVNIDTGMMSEKTRRQRTAKSADARKFFQELRRDSWKFWKSNVSLALRTAAYLTVLSLVSFACLFMVYWCLNLPPKTFWALCAFVFGAVGPGWLLLVQLDLISFTFERKKKLKPIRFDFFLSAALGIRLLFWAGLMAALFQIVTGTLGYMLMRSNPAIGYALIGLGCLPVVLVFPIAASHMAMPVTKSAWLIHKLLMSLLKTWKGVAYWFVFLIAANLPALACFGVIGVMYAADVKEFLDTTSYNATVEAERSKVGGKKGGELVPDKQTQRKLAALAKPREVDPTVLVVPGVLWVVGCTALGLVSPFTMRSTGLFTLYFRHNLDLVTRAKETTYTSRAAEIYVEEGKSTVMVAWLLFGLVAALCIFYSAMAGVLVLGLIGAVVAAFYFVPMAGLWRILEKAGEPGWQAIFPAIMSRSLLRMAGYTDWYWVLALAVPGLGFYIWYKGWVVMAARFEKSESYALGLAFMGLVFYPLLGFGDDPCLKLEHVKKKEPPEKKGKAKKKPSN